MKTRNVTLDILVLLIGVGEIVGVAIENHDLQMVFKPAIMLSMLFYLYYMLRKHKSAFRTQMMIAFVFALAGDIFLLFSNMDEIFFILGLAAFLVTHIVYLFAMRHKKSARHKTSILEQEPFIAMPVILTGLAALATFVSAGKIGTMLTPVIVYTAAIVAMVIVAMNRNNKTTTASYQMMFRGALLFMISDMFIAIDRFVSEIPANGIIVMVTYIFAQYLIMRGAIEHGLARD